MDNIIYKLIVLISQFPDYSQRDFAEALDVSLGKINSTLKFLIAENYIKIISIDSRTNRYYLTELGKSMKGKYYLKLIEDSYWIIEKLALKVKILKKKYKIMNKPINIFCIEEQDEIFLKILKKEDIFFNIIKNIETIEETTSPIYTLNPETKTFLENIKIKCINILEEI